MIIATMPGRFGDILWSLPTVRALSLRHDEPVHFRVSAKYGAIVPLLRQQVYLADALADPMWQVEETAPMTPFACPLTTSTDAIDEDIVVYHLGYRGWPERHLPYEAAAPAGIKPSELRLDKPWIAEPTMSPSHTVAVGFSDEWIELKMGILFGLAALFPGTRFCVLHPRASRQEAWLCGRLPPNIEPAETSWQSASTRISHSTCFLGCLSGLWVLANALGKRTVIVEPNPQRHHPIFWNDAPRNRIVTGNDGKPTFDLRHVCNALEEIIHG